MKLVRVMYTLKGLAVHVSLVAALLLPVPAVAAPSASEARDEVTNQTCPVTTGEPIDPEQFVEVDGQRIYFCCAKCRRQYLRDPERYADSVASVLPASIGADTGSTQESKLGVEEHAGEIDHHNGEGPHEHEKATSVHAHDHAHEPPGERSLLKWLGRFHPASVHFPIAMLLGALLAEVLLSVTKRPIFDGSARFCLWSGALSGLATATLGWLFGGFAVSDGDWVMTAHRWIGTSAPVLAVAALALRETRRPGRSRIPYLAVLGLAAASVAINGFLGGALIYGLDHYAF